MGNEFGELLGKLPRLRAVIGLKPLVGLDELLVDTRFSAPEEIAHEKSCRRAGKPAGPAWRRQSLDLAPSPLSPQRKMALKTRPAT